MILIDPAPVLPFPLWMIIAVIAEKKYMEKKKDEKYGDNQKK